MTAALRLDPSDEYPHRLEEATNFNESMYANVLDGPGRLGVWVRVGNRPNEGHAEVTCCVYLPDGRVGFMFARPDCTTNDAIAAGGAAFEVVEPPFRQVRVTYDGPLCLLTDPTQMSDPATAFASNPVVPARVDVVMDGLADPFGGEPQGDAEPVLASFARGHYEQHVRGTGSIVVGGETHELAGRGLRDHSWGPRYWQNVAWSRFMPMAFTDDFAMCPVLIGDDAGGQHPGGMVLRRATDGSVGYVPITDVEFESRYDESHYARGQRMRVTTAEREYVIDGEALSLIPLRNRRGGQTTRITEAMSRFTCDGLDGFGMSEYLDQMVDDRPAGWPA